MSRTIPLDEWNASAPLAALGATPTPADAFYTRSNFGVPDVDVEDWRLTIDGLVEASRSFTLDELRALGEQTRLVTVECAGNGRLLMDPVPDGAPWGLGAVSVGEFAGVPLATVLDRAGLEPEAREFVFTGADRGTVEPEGEINYAFSLPSDLALDHGPMLAWEMNGEPLTAAHGAPLRLMVPGHYGMCSVKWLTTITAIPGRFEGHFRLKYRYFGDPHAPEEARVGPIRVRSLITDPEEGSAVGGLIEVKGVAWSGGGAIASVDVQVDDGDWFAAVVGPQGDPSAPAPWSAKVALSPGEHRLAARATDDSGNTQPLTSIWNRNGYANNVVHRIDVTVT